MSLIAALLIAIPPDHSLANPRPCRDTVSVSPVASVEGVGSPESESVVRWLPRTTGPEFPAELRSVGQGRVVARFVVDSAGRVIKGTAVIVSETKRGFGRSVCQFLEQQARFEVGTVEGEKAQIEVRNAAFEFRFWR